MLSLDLVQTARVRRRSCCSPATALKRRGPAARPLQHPGAGRRRPARRRRRRAGARARGVTLVAFDTTLQAPLMIAFFTTIGFGASVGAAAGRRPAGARLLPARPRSSPSSRTSSAPSCAVPLGQHAAVRRARRLGDADRRPGAPASRSRRSSRRPACRRRRTLAVAAAMVGIVAGGAHRRSGRHLADRAARPAPRRAAGRRRSRTRIAAQRRRSAAAGAGDRQRRRARTARPTPC